MTLPADPVLALHSDATLRAVAGEGVVLMVTTGQIYTCNETAMDALSRMDGVAPLSRIADDMAGTYDVDPEVLKADVAELLDYLHGEGVLVQVT